MGNSPCKLSSKAFEENDVNLTGTYTVSHDEYDFEGELKDGKFDTGKLFKNESLIASGKFKNNQIAKGLKVVKASELFECFIFTTDSELSPDLYADFGDEPLYAVGEFDNNMLNGLCSVYYDSELTSKAVSGKFEDNVLVQGEIFADDDENILLERGLFYNGLISGFALRSVASPCTDDVFDYYMKINADDENLANSENDYTGLGEYYYSANAANLAIKAYLVENELMGDCVHYTPEGKLLFSGKVFANEAVFGLVYHQGFYVESNLRDGVAVGDAIIYSDSEKKDKYAEGYYSDGKLNGRVSFYDNGRLRKTAFYSDDREQHVIMDFDAKPKMRDLDDCYSKWLSAKLENNDWLSSYNQDDKSHFTSNVTDEIESFLKMVKQESRKESKPNQTNLESFTIMLTHLLNNPNDFRCDADFTETLQADIYEEFTSYCKLSLTCGLINQDEFEFLTMKANDYLYKFARKETNQYTAESDNDDDDTKTPVKTPPVQLTPSVEEWLEDKLTNANFLKSAINNNLASILASRYNDDNVLTYAQFILYSLSNPTHNDVKKKRDIQMKDAYRHLRELYSNEVSNQ